MKDKMRKALGFLGLIEDEYGDYASNGTARPFTDPPEYEDAPEWSPAAAPRPAAVSPGQSRAGGALGARRPSSISVLDSVDQSPRMRPMPSSRTRGGVTIGPDREPMIFFPNSYDESRRVTDLLRSSRAVVLNLSELDAVVARRLVDFASGTAYALNAKIERLDAGVYLICPQGANLSAEAKAQLRVTNFRSFGPA